MKVALIAPSRSQAKTYYTNNPGLMKFFEQNRYVPAFFHPNLALLTLAALTPEYIEIELVDERVDTIHFEHNFDVVAITMITAQALRGYEIARQSRQQGIYTVAGGIHPTVLPEEAIAEFDTVIIGEAENTWPKFLKDFMRGSPKRLYRDQSVDLSKSPIPRYDLLDTSKFHLLPLQATRGCPYDCSFCSVTTVYGPRYRVKSTDQIVKEVQAIQRVAGNRRCVFNDDNFFVNRNRAYEILRAIQPLGVKYFAETDISVAEDQKLLGLLRDSGCKTLFIGFESLVPENLRQIQKSGYKLRYLPTYKENCERIQSHGIQVLGSFMVGLDHDTRDNLLRLRDFVLETNIWAQFPFLAPFPGTKLRQELVKQGRLSASNANWDLYTCFDAIFKPAMMTVKELEETVLEMYETVYTDVEHRRRMRHMLEHMNI